MMTSAPHRRSPAFARAAPVRARAARRPCVSPRRRPICAAAPAAPATPPRIAPAVLNANATIVGAGPVGCVLALLLQQHGVRVTLVERNARAPPLVPPRAHSFGVNNRGLQVLSRLPRLARELQRIGTRSFPPRRHVRQPDGSWTVATLGRLAPGKKPSLSVSRHSFVSLCRDEIDAASSVTCMYETALDDVLLGDDGQLQLRLKSASGHVTSINTRLLLACDGVRSPCAQLLQNAPVRSRAGLERLSFPTYAQRLQAKILMLHPHFHKSEPGSNIDDDQYAPGDYMMYTFHNIYPSRMKHSLLLDIFPQSQHVINTQGGVRAAVRAHPSHVVWRLTDANSAINLFEKELPLLRPREVISEQAMSTFLSVEPLNLPSVARRASLCATAAKGTDPSGIVFLGDSAHSFPPDVGEGLNAGLQDAFVFVNALVEGGLDDTPSQLVTRYERLREPETAALMRFAQRSVIATVPSRFDAFNLALRSGLAKRFPGVFYAPAVFLRSACDSYEEIMQRADQTTMRLYIGAALLVAGISVPIALLLAAI